MAATQTAEGGCLCGKLRYRVAKPPARTTICHCRFCQRATGGPYMIEPIFERSDLSVIKGEPKVYTQASAGSGKDVHVHFCDTCGTKLFLTFERFPDIAGVYGGTFDDPNWFEISGATAKHIFLGVARTGTIIPPDFDTFVEHAIRNDGTPIEPTVFRAPKVAGPT